MTVTDDEHDAAPVVDAPPKAGKARRPPSGPAARFEPGKVAETRHRNPTWLVAGVLLVLVSALGGVLLFASSDDRADVLVAAADLQPGRPVGTWRSPCRARRGRRRHRVDVAASMPPTSSVASRSGVSRPARC